MHRAVALRGIGAAPTVEQPTPHPVGVAALAAAQQAGFRCADNVSGGPG
jgi:hypothetical protein